jgi:hypothetical protein
MDRLCGIHSAQTLKVDPVFFFVSRIRKRQKSGSEMACRSAFGFDWRRVGGMAGMSRKKIRAARYTLEPATLCYKQLY